MLFTFLHHLFLICSLFLLPLYLTQTLVWFLLSFNLLLSPCIPLPHLETDGAPLCLLCKCTLNNTDFHLMPLNCVTAEQIASLARECRTPSDWQGNSSSCLLLDWVNSVPLLKKSTWIREIKWEFRHTDQCYIIGKTISEMLPFFKLQWALKLFSLRL